MTRSVTALGRLSLIGVVGRWGLLEVTDAGVVEEHHAGGVDLYAAGCPSDPELVAVGGQLPPMDSS
jgi:hypothetical protein